MTTRTLIVIAALMTLLPQAALSQESPAVQQRPVQFGTDFKTKAEPIPVSDVQPAIRTADCPGPVRRVVPASRLHPQLKPQQNPPNRPCKRNCNRIANQKWWHERMQ
jgi:hypothetical protein